MNDLKTMLQMETELSLEYLYIVRNNTFPLISLCSSNLNVYTLYVFNFVGNKIYIPNKL